MKTTVAGSQGRHNPTADACPKCGSHDLTFVEHSSEVTIYSCGQCGAAVALATRAPKR